VRDGTLALSVILATDLFSTIDPVVRHLHAQTVVDKLEIVIVSPRADEVRRQAAGVDAFGSVVVVGVDTLVPLSVARAVGIRAATAPIVFVGETHTYPEEGWAEALIDAHTGDWAAVVPGFGNANPSGALSWASFLADYGAWLNALEPCELPSIPTHNTAYKRSVLLEFGPRLDRLLTSGDELIVDLRAAGQRFAFHPSARIDHANVALLWPWLLERYLGGLLTANSRMERWSLGRRLLYAAGSPFIPAVVLGRVASGVTAARQAYSVPRGVYPALLVGAVARAIGELVGYLGGSSTWAERRMTEYEVHKLRYLRA
jgi:hypothetical protein